MRKKPPPVLARLERKYADCRRQLSGIGYISQGSVQDRTARTGGGAGYQWTRKVAAKTVTVSLTQQQFKAMQTAVQTRRTLAKLIREMERISRHILFITHPHLDRRKPLSAKVLGIK